MSVDELIEFSHEVIKGAMPQVPQPNAKADVAPASGAHVQRVVGCEPSNGEKQ